MPEGPNGSKGGRSCQCSGVVSGGGPLVIRVEKRDQPSGRGVNKVKKETPEGLTHLSARLTGRGVDLSTLLL